VGQVVNLRRIDNPPNAGACIKVAAAAHTSMSQMQNYFRPDSVIENDAIVNELTVQSRLGVQMLGWITAIL
jgi:hypothetical protein